MGWFSRKKKRRNPPPDSGAYPSARWAEEEDLEAIGAFEPEGIPIGYFEGRQFYDGAPRSDKETKPHRTIIGDTGSWKTSGLYIPWALSLKDYNIIAVDTAGDYASTILRYRSTLGHSYVVDPSGMTDEMDIGSSIRALWSPTADFLCVGNPLIFPSRAERVTSFTSRSHRGGGDNAAFFTSLSQRGIQGTMMAQALHAPKHATLPDIIKLFNNDFFAWVRWLFRENDVDPVVRDLLNPFHIPEARQYELKSILDVINTVASDTKWISNAAISRSLRGSDFSYAPPTDDVFTVTLCAPLHLLADGFDRLIAMHLGCAATQLQAKRRAKGTIIICDELAQYCSDAVAETISRLFATGRKYNCRVFISVTSLGQLKQCFRHGTYNDVLGNSGVIHVMHAADPDTTTFLKELSGQKIAYSRSSTRGSSDGKNTSSQTTSPHEVPVLRAHEARGVSSRSQIVVFDQCPHLIFAEKERYFENPELNARAGKNPFAKKQPPELPAKTRKARRKKVDEVAILKKVWG